IYVAICYSFFIFLCSPAHRALHSFPTRRSSDLWSSDAQKPSWKCGRRSLPPGGHPGTIGTCRAEPPEDPDVGKELTSRPRGRERSEEHTSELQSRFDLVCRLLLEKKKKTNR